MRDSVLAHDQIFKRPADGIEQPREPTIGSLSPWPLVLYPAPTGVWILDGGRNYYMLITRSRIAAIIEEPQRVVTTVASRT